MRSSVKFRETKETSISVNLNLDGSGICQANTPIGFLNHMLESFSKHSKFDLTVKASGDIDVSYHHTVEDVGITIGMALNEALGNRFGINRFGHCILPMDEALVLVALDIGGRGLIFYDDMSLRGKITNFDFELIWEFFKGLCLEARICAHIKVLNGKILHHVAEACFKAFAVSLKQAVSISRSDIPSTKGEI
ncbi:MAG: imidazoleglycerol-phosphate dehydratase HisB [Aquificaceae bacterium]|nr:imidazoleglycerol-phosphate dehydratase HisB [Aquificaceae bacterium]